MPSVAIVGDLIIDRSFFCTPKGVSPEAPIISMEVNRVSDTIGGAGNVALNLIALSELLEEEVTIQYVGPIPEPIWTILLRMGKEKYFHYYAGRAELSSVKNRIVHKSPWRQIIRFDEDTKKKLKQIDEDTIVSYFKENSFDVGLISDYAHGAITRRVCQAVRDSCTAVIADPKGKDPHKYTGVSIVTPNTTELETLTNSQCTSEEERARAISVICGADVIHKKGANGCCYYPAYKKEKYFAAQSTICPPVDPCGAGDTFIATLTYHMAIGKGIEESITAANVMAGLSVLKPGCFVPNKEAILKFRELTNE